jgi:PKD repeat protein
MKNLSIILTGLLFLFASCSKKQAQPQPVADFSIVYTNDVAPAKITFQNNSSQALTYSWDFGNGETSQEENAEHIFMNPGTYDVTLIARNGGQSTQVTKQITIQQPYSKGKIISVKIIKVPTTDNGSNWDFDGTTPDIYFSIYNSSGNMEALLLSYDTPSSF